MNTHHKAAILGCLAVATGTIVWKRWAFFGCLSKSLPDMPFIWPLWTMKSAGTNWKGMTSVACESNFPTRWTLFRWRYHLFLQMNQKKSRQQILDEIAAMEQRLQDSRQYIGQPSVNLSASISQK